MYSTIVLQDGPIKEHGVNGDQIDVILQFVVDKLSREAKGGALNSRENSLAITHCEEALHWLAARTAARTARGVEGTNQP